MISYKNNFSNLKCCPSIFKIDGLRCRLNTGADVIRRQEN